MNRIIIIGVLSLLTGCASIQSSLQSFLFGTEKVTTSRVVPAEYNMSAYKGAVITDVQGPYSNNLGSALKGEITSSKFFNLYTKGTDVNSSIFSVEAEVSDKQFSQSHESGQGTCYNNRKKYKCTIYTTFGTWTATALFRVSNAKTGEVLWQKSISQKSEDSKQTQNAPVAYDEGSGFRLVMLQIAHKFINSVQPSTVTHNVDLFQNDSLKGTKKGIKSAKAGKWNDAVVNFEKSINDAKKQKIDDEPLSKAYYNYGVALGYGGIDFDESVKMLEQAYSLNQDEDYLQEIANIKSIGSDVIKLAGQGYNTL